MLLLIIWWKEININWIYACKEIGASKAHSDPSAHGPSVPLHQTETIQQQQWQTK